MSATLENGTFFGGVRAERRVGALTLAETGYAPGFQVPAHDHAHPFFCLALGGTFVERFEGRAWTGRATSVFFHPSGAEHSESFGTRGGRLFNVQLGAAWVAALRRFDIAPPDRQVEAAGGRLATLATGLYREFRRDDPASDLAVDGLALALLAEVVRHGTRPRLSGARPAWLARVEEMLHARAALPMDIAAIAAEVDVHPVHLARVFRRHHGCAPAEYLRRLRIRRACELLAGPAPLAAIALATGFSDQSHFTRNFRRELGVTPGEYRRLVG